MSNRGNNISQNLTNREIDSQNYGPILANMKKILDNFYPDYAKENSSAYVLLNKINNDIKSSPETAKRLDQAKNKF